MLNYINKVLNQYTLFIQCIFFVFCSFLNNISLANTHSSDQPLQLIDYQIAKDFIKNLRANKIDYLKNEKKFQKVFEISRDNSWEEIHLEAAALYAELLFRQEKYEALKNHINAYIDKEAFKKNGDLYLLLLEAKLKYLSREEDPTNAKVLAKQLESWLLIYTDKENIIILRALSYFYTSVDNIKQTLRVALEGLELAKADNDFSSQGFFLRKISDAYNFSADKVKAINFSKQAINAYEKTQDEHLTSKAYWSMGTILHEMKKNKEALVYLNKALLYFKSVHMNTGIAFSQYMIASIKFSEKNYDEALIDVNENIILAKAAGVYDMQLASMVLLSDIYIETDLIEKANEVNDNVFSLIDKFSRSIYKSDFLSKRYKLKKRLGLNDDAFEAIELELIYTKKHLEATSETNIKTLKVKFNVKEKEDEIFHLAQINNINELKAKEEYQQKVIWRLSTAIAVILVLVSLFFFLRQVQQRKKYHMIAMTDYLTRSTNRRGILLIAETQFQEKELTIAIVDLDFFKKINDTAGHDVGDLILIAFANAARKTLREKDYFGRYGGEEWLFILNTTDEFVIQNIFIRLKENFFNYCIDIKLNNPKIKWDITFSMGASIRNSSHKKLDSQIKSADKLLYHAKENGRNKVVVG